MDVSCKKDGYYVRMHDFEEKVTLSHTYINSHYNPSVRIIDLVSHITYVVCVNCMHKWQDLQFKKSTPNDRFFEKVFMTILFTRRAFARNLLRGNHRRNTFCILF